MPTMNNNVLILFFLLVSNGFFYRICHASSSYSRLISTGLEPHPRAPIGEQPLAKIVIHKAVIVLHKSASIRANPFLLGLQGEDTEWINVKFEYSEPSEDDWVGVFSPAKFNDSDCESESGNWPEVPYLCTAPIKYMFANHSTANYVETGKASLRFQIINQRADFSFALFTGGLENPKLVAVSDPISFANPKAPLYPRLAHGKAWNEMTVTWTSGYNIDEATPLVEWGWKGQTKQLSPAGTLTFTRGSMCDTPSGSRSPFSDEFFFDNPNQVGLHLRRDLLHVHSSLLQTISTCWFTKWGRWGNCYIQELHL